MNTQDILNRGGTKLDAVLDFSEYYDYELVENIIGKLDIVLDYSEYYDYTIANNDLDYIYHETFPYTNFILTEDGYIISTEDNYLIEYIE